MCSPSSSASAAIIILWYFKLSKLKSSPIPVPNAFITSSSLGDFNISDSLEFSTLFILPNTGNIAWVLASLAFLQEPPAESPSANQISHSSAFLEEQVVNLSGIPPNNFLAPLFLH